MLILKHSALQRPPQSLDHNQARDYNKGKKGSAVKKRRERERERERDEGEREREREREGEGEGRERRGECCFFFF